MGFASTRTPSHLSEPCRNTKYRIKVPHWFLSTKNSNYGFLISKNISSMKFSIDISRIMVFWYLILSYTHNNLNEKVKFCAKNSNSSIFFRLWKQKYASNGYPKFFRITEELSSSPWKQTEYLINTYLGTAVAVKAKTGTLGNWFLRQESFL